MGKRIVVVALAVIFAVSGALAFAYEGKCCESKGHYEKLEDKVVSKAHKLLENKEKLGLSDGQVKKITALKLKAKKELIRQNAEIEVLGLDIKAKMYDESVDLAAINTLIDKKYEVKKAKTKSLMAAYVELKSILTEKQKDMLKEIYQKCTREKKEYRKGYSHK